VRVKIFLSVAWLSVAWLSVACLSVAWLGLICSAQGQQVVRAPVPSARPPAQATRYSLDVVVTDKAGHSVPGLQQADFTLLDSGQPATITSFAAIDTNAPAASPSPAAPTAAQTQVVLVIDEVNTPFVAVGVERIQLHNFLTQNQGHLALPVTIALVTDTGVKQMNHPSTDGNALDAQLQQEQGSLRAITRSGGFYGGADRLQISLQTLNQIVGNLVPVPGRKLVIWISQGWWMFNVPNVITTDSQRRAFFGAVVGFSDSLLRGQITLYAVDPLGTRDAGSPAYFQWQDFLKPVPSAKKVDPGDVSLQVLAAHSGGLYLFGSNDIASEVAKCVSDGTAYYRLTFDPVHSETPDTWHALEVKLDKQGLNIRTAYGYYAQP
jgi:VWFA-related protein